MQSTNYSNASYHVWLTYIYIYIFLRYYLCEKEFYHQQSHAFCRVKLFYGDNWYEIKKKIGLTTNFIGRPQSIGTKSSQNYIHWCRQVKLDGLTGKT